MSVYVVSLVTGVGVGIIYWLIGVRSPAPPIVALVGLLGIVVGEHAIPFMRDHIGPALATWLGSR